jgi:hypothetical protein
MKMRPGMVLAFAVALSGTLAGCGLFGGDPEVGTVDVPLDITAATVDAIVDVEVTFSNGGALDSSFAGAEVAFKFKSSTTWEAKVNGETVDGSIVYGSCSFFFANGSAFTGNPFDPCKIDFSGDGNDAQAVVTFGTVTSTPASFKFEVKDNNDGTCNLEKNGVVVAVVACGDSGSTGV